MRTDRILVLAALTWTACGGGSGSEPVTVTDVNATVAEKMGTVVTVTWTTSEPVIGSVAFGETAALGRESLADSEPTTDHTATLVGLPADTPVSFQILSEGEPDPTVHDVTTGPLEDVPDLVLTGAQDLFLAMPVVQEESTHVVVVDPQGRVVWSHQDNRETAVYRARVSADGTGIVYTATVFRGEPHPGSALVRVDWDGTERHLDVPYLAHDFVELADGTVISLAYEYRDDLQGNKLVQIDPDGTVTDIWSAWDCFDPEVHISSDPDHGWIHANALDYDESTDSFLVGMRNLSTVVKVDRATGACDWAVGRGAGDIESTGGTFLHQHQFGWIGDRFLVFDNMGAPGLESRVLEYAFDPEAGTASVVREILGDPGIFSLILGDVHRFEDGDTLIVWSANGYAERVTADDSRTWTLTGPDGAIFGFVEPWYDAGRPDLGPFFP